MRNPCLSLDSKLPGRLRRREEFWRGIGKLTLDVCVSYDVHDGISPVVVQHKDKSRNALIGQEICILTRETGKEQIRQKLKLI